MLPKLINWRYNITTVQNLINILSKVKNNESDVSFSYNYGDGDNISPLNIANAYEVWNEIVLSNK